LKRSILNNQNSAWHLTSGVREFFPGHKLNRETERGWQQAVEFNMQDSFTSRPEKVVGHSRKGVTMNTKVDKLRNYTIIARLDDAIPLNTEEWMTVERLLNQVSEFVPMSMLNNLTEAIITYADDQARRGYLLGQEDLVQELKKKAARIA
jgi:hypothetical protein